MTAPTALADFLLARFAEDEAVARAAAERNGAEWGTCEVQDGARVTGDLRRESNPRAYGEDDALWDDEGALGMWEETATHVARHDPARVLAECEAKRRIVEQVQKWAATGNSTLRAVEEQILLNLALPYADRPGYREEWRP